jgi:hypothetical protein
MRASFVPEDLFSLEQDVDTPVNVVVAYEDFYAGSRAKAVFDRIAGHLRSANFLKCEMWKFNVLEVPGLSRLAASEAARAHLIVVAAHEGRELLDAVQDWIRGRLVEKGEMPRALVAILNHDETVAGNRTPVATCLRKMAETAKVDFFCHASKWPEVLNIGEDESSRDGAGS